MRCVAIALLCVVGAPVAIAAGGGTLEVRLLGADGAPVTGAAVTASAIGPQTLPAAPVEARIDQINMEFVPKLSIVPVGSSIAFPNGDTISHQVYSFSPARRFQLPLYRGQPHAPVRFDTPGVVALGCNIHDSMVGYVLVTTAAHYGVTDQAGMLRLRSLPPGEYEVRIWHPRMRERGEQQPQRVRLPAAAGFTLEIRLSDALKPSPGASRASRWDY